MKTTTKRQMDLNDRMTIELGLLNKDSISKIAKKMHVHTSTITRELKNNRTFISGFMANGNDCRLASRCHRYNVCAECSKAHQGFCSYCVHADCRMVCDKYISMRCYRFESTPYVCNTCSERRNCNKDRYLYGARYADDLSKKRHSEKRQGLRITPEQLCDLDALVTPLVKKGQSLSHIHATHVEEIPVSLRTLYRLVEDCELSIRNIDLRRKAKNKPRKKKKPTIDITQTRGCRAGRTFEEFEAYISNKEPLLATEMDTVKGTRSVGKCLLTMILRKNSVMLMFLLPNCRAKAVKDCFDFLEVGLGLDAFTRLFPVIITDNGSEFKHINDLELSDSVNQRTHIFYCDPMASWQKPHIERNHEYIRYVIPKGKSMETYTQEDITLLSNHINSAKRPVLGNRSPYEMISKDDEDMHKLMALMKMHPIPNDEVHLLPSLLK